MLNGNVIQSKNREEVEGGLEGHGEIKLGFAGGVRWKNEEKRVPSRRHSERKCTASVHTQSVGGRTGE